MNRLTIDIQPYLSLLDEQAEAFGVFQELLIRENQKYNLTRITSPPQVRTRHFLDSLAGLTLLDDLSKSLAKPLRILDAGSGAGFPGLVLAIARPQWQFLSLEATDKKVRFQQIVIDALKLQNVRIVHGRSEALAHQPACREQFDAVTARALAPMPVLAEITLGLVAEQGLGLYWKGSHGNAEAQQARQALQHMGGRLESVAAYRLPEGEEQDVDFSLVVCRKIAATPKKYPRVFGLIKKSPLGSTP